jgi:hypothetical protein
VVPKDWSIDMLRVFLICQALWFSFALVNLSTRGSDANPQIGRKTDAPLATPRSRLGLGFNVGFYVAPVMSYDSSKRGVVLTPNSSFILSTRPEDSMGYPCPA